MPHPTYQEGDESTFELVVAGRALADGDIAIMMVEAGGTERCVAVLPSRRAQGHRGRRWPAASRQPRRGSASRSSCSTSSSKQGRCPPADRLRARARLRATTCGTQVVAARHRADREGASPSPTRPSATQRSTTAAASIQAAMAEAFPGREKEIKAAVRSLTKKLMRKRIVEDGVRMDGRGPADLRPCRPRSASSPPRTAPACSSAARRRCSTSSRSACRGSDQSIGIDDTIAEEPRSASCTTTTCRPTPTARPGRLGTKRR